MSLISKLVYLNTPPTQVIKIDVGETPAKDIELHHAAGQGAFTNM